MDWGDYTPGPWRWRGDEELIPGLRMADALVGPEQVHPLSVTKEPEPTSVISVNSYSDNLVVGNADARLISKAYLIPRLEATLERVAGLRDGRPSVIAAAADALADEVRALLDELRSA